RARRRAGRESGRGAGSAGLEELTPRHRWAARRGCPRAHDGSSFVPIDKAQLLRLRSGKPCVNVPMYGGRCVAYAGPIIHCDREAGASELISRRLWQMNSRSVILGLALSLAAGGPALAADLLVTQYKNDPSGAPYAIALEKGLFKKHGIHITDIVSGAGGGSSVPHALGSDLGYGDVTAAPVIAAAEQGQDVKIVGFTSRSLADLVLIVMPNSPIKTVADLKGKKFGISNPKSLGEMMGVLVMEQAGLKQGD